jgi:hypothetical protein
MVSYAVVAGHHARSLAIPSLAGFKLDFILSPTTMAWGNRSIYSGNPDGNLVNVLTRVDSPPELSGDRWVSGCQQVGV